MKNQNNRINKVGLIFVLGLVITINIYPKKVKLDPESEEFYNYARHLFTKHERKVFLNLPNKEVRDRFIQHFWEIRNPNPLTEENEFKLAMEERFEYVSKYLSEGPVPGWKTDRGRIYILLGPPDFKEEKPILKRVTGVPNIGIVVWYYAESKILAVFIDKEGHGFFRLDPNRTSMRLLDELENRKYYIVSKKNSIFIFNLLEFNLKYDSEINELQYELSSKNVTFEELGSQVMAKFKISIMLYFGKDDFSKYTEVKTVYLDKETLLGKKSKIEISIPITLPQGNITVDSIIIDLLGDASRRKFVNLEVKRKQQ